MVFYLVAFAALALLLLAIWGVVKKAIASWRKIPKASLVLALFLLPALAMAQETPRPPPSDAELLQHKMTAQAAELTYARMLITRLSAELESSEARGQWAANKLWQMPIAEAK